MRKNLTRLALCFMVLLLVVGVAFAREWTVPDKTGLIPVKGGHVFYRMYGEDKPGTPLLVLHGGPGGNMQKYYNMVEFVKDRPVVFYNQLGSAATAISAEYTTVEQIQSLLTVERFVNELETVVNHFKFKQYNLLGVSWGSWLAVNYYLDKKPVGLKSMVLTGPFLNVNMWIADAERLIKSLPDGDAHWDVVEDCIAKNDFDTPEYKKVDGIYYDNFGCRDQSVLADLPPKDPAAINFAGKAVSVYNYMWGPSEYTCNGTLKGKELSSRLGEVKVPVLYVSGEYDSGTPETANYYKSLTPDAEVFVIPNTGHNSYLEKPDMYYEKVSEFLKVSNKGL